MTGPLDPRLRAALAEVVDPEMGLDVVRLGLIYAADLPSDGTARITMTTTTRGCPLSGFLRDSVARAAAGVEGVEAVEVTLTYDPPWTPAFMDRDDMPRPAGSASSSRRRRGWLAWFQSMLAP